MSQSNLTNICFNYAPKLMPLEVRNKKQWCEKTGFVPFKNKHWLEFPAGSSGVSLGTQSSSLSKQILSTESNGTPYVYFLTGPPAAVFNTEYIHYCTRSHMHTSSATFNDLPLNKLNINSIGNYSIVFDNIETVSQPNTTPGHLH